MNVTVLGPPTSGKTTQANRIADHFDLPYLSTGQILRENREMETGHGTPAEYMEAGRLVPDDVVMEVVRQQLRQERYREEVVFDGFPRTIEQAEGLHEIREIDVAILLEVEDYVVLQRMSNRMECPSCSMSYNVETNPPHMYGICDRCGAELERRADDERSVTRRKLLAYKSTTKKLIDFYEAYGTLRRIDAGAGVDEVWSRVRSVLERDSNQVEQ